MYRHVALFRFKPDATAEQRATVLDVLRTLPAQIPEIKDFRVGPNAGDDEGNAEFAVVADFENAGDYAIYQRHPAHQAVLSEHIRPILASRTAAQYEC